jgi:hypothetical protein
MWNRALNKRLGDHLEFVGSFASQAGNNMFVEHAFVGLCDLPINH